jgi:hypothetical protein
MNAFARLVAVVAIASGAVVGAAASAAETAAAAPAAARYYPLVGDWKGRGELSEPGQPPVALALNLSCSKTASGWAVRCELAAKNDKMTITESDLMGVDPVTGKGHWYAVTSQGETHDHVAEWSDARTMKAHHAWTQDGKTMEEDATFTRNGSRSLEFRSVTSADGKAVGVFSGKLVR